MDTAERKQTRIHNKHANATMHAKTGYMFECFFFPWTKSHWYGPPFVAKPLLFLIIQKDKTVCFEVSDLNMSTRQQNLHATSVVKLIFSRGRWGLGRGGVGRVTIIGLLKGVSKSTTGYRKFQVSSIKTLNRFKCWNSRAFTDYANQFCRI